MSSSADLLAQARDVVSRLEAQRAENPLSILRLSEPITNTSSSVSTDTRASNASSSSSALSDSHQNASTDPTPSTLTADLSHYRDLFTKLHFSYIEQVTKEKYLRAIVGDPPVLHTHQENVELETEVTAMKTALKEKKVESDKLVEAMKSEATALADRWENVCHELERVRVLQEEVRASEERLEQLRQEVAQKEHHQEAMDIDGRDGRPQQESSSSSNHPKLGLEDTLALIASREQEKREMEQRVQDLKSDMPAKTKECELAERDLDAFEGRKIAAITQAMEARRRKEQGEKGGRDVVEERGRWYKSQEQVYKGLGLVEG